MMACSQEAKHDSFVEPTIDYTIDQKNDLISSYAQILASSIADTELRNTIKSEAQEQFDGDYDILISTLETLDLNEQNMTVKQKMSERPVLTRSAKGGFEGNLEDLMDEIKKVFPNLQVSVPVHCDEWDPDNYIPMVAFLPCDYDEDTIEYIEAFDIDGNTHILSAVEEPEYPVIVVSVSERIDENGNFLYDDDFSEKGAYIGNDPTTKATINTPTGISLKHSTARSFELYWDGVVSSGHYEIERRALNENTFSLIAQVDGDENFYKDNSLVAGTKYSYRLRLIDGTDQSAYTPIITSTASQRAVGEPLKLVWYEMDKETLQDVEIWINGRPEIRMIVFYGVNSGDDTAQVYNQLLSPTREHIKEGCNPDATIFTQWDPNTEGSVLTFVWVEEDPNGSYEIGAEVKYEHKFADGTLTSGVTGKYMGEFEDKEIGRGHMCWWDSYDTLFDQGIRFRLGKQ